MYQRKAFTLIELLVVIAIIALLLSIMVPSLRTAKKVARDITCRSHLKQWTLVYEMYTMNNDDNYPIDYNYAWTRESVWMWLLSDLYDGMEEFKFCLEATKYAPPPLDVGMGATFTAWGITRLL